MTEVEILNSHADHGHKEEEKSNILVQIALLLLSSPVTKWHPRKSSIVVTIPWKTQLAFVHIRRHLTFPQDNFEMILVILDLNGTLAHCMNEEAKKCS